MRRVGICLGVVLASLIPAPAQAWWEFIEALSGPGKWKGPDLDARLVCFVEKTTRQSRAGSNDFTMKAKATSDSVKALTISFEAGKDGEAPARVVALAKQWQDAVSQWNQVLETWERLAGRAAYKGAGSRELALHERERAERSFAAAEAAARALAAARDAVSGTAFDQAAKIAREDAAAALNSYETASDVMSGAAETGIALIMPGPGFIVSACRLREGEKRRAAIDLSMRVVWTHDRRYVADPERINLTILEPAFSWGVFDDERYDVVDYGVGAGFFWVTSKSFPTVTGTVLEPIRFDVHGATRWPKWTRAAVFRVGLLSFPAGFDLNAFAPRNGFSPGRVGRDWALTYGFFADLEQLHKKRPH